MARYSDNCNLYVRSERAGQRVLEKVSRPVKLVANKFIAPRNHMGACDLAKFFRPPDSREARKIRDGMAVCALGVRVVDVAEPLDLWRYVGKPLEFRAVRSRLLWVSRMGDFA